MVRYRAKAFSGFLLAFIIILSYSPAFASDKPSAWDDKYKDEPYVWLIWEKVVSVGKDYSTTTSEHIVKRVQKEGAKDLGEIPITYDKSCEEVEKIEAYTITPDGKKLQCEKVQDLSSSGDSSIYSDERVKMITMPGVVVGSVIDLRTVVKRNKPVIENNFYNYFYYSASAPIKEARYVVRAPKGMSLNIKALNASIEPTVDTDGDDVVYTWTIQNSDKVEKEEYMPSSEEIYKSIWVSTLKSWPQLAAWDWPLFKKNFKVSPEMKKKVEELTAGKTSVEDKVQAVIEYIRSDYRYVSMNMESHNYEPHPADEIFKNKYGDCKDQTLLAIAMLSEVGVKAWPALLSTYSELRREDLLPMPTYFNHVILALEAGGKLYYTDVLYKGYRFQDIPSAYDGKKIFVVNDHGGFFTVLPFSDKDETTNRSNESVTIREDGTTTIVTNVTFSRSLSVSLREALKQMGPDEKEKLFSGLETAIASGGKIIEKTWNNLDTPYTQITGTIRYESTCFVQRMGDMMVFGMPQETRNRLFTAPKRVYPIVFLSSTENESRVTYTIPEGYEIMVLPKKVSLDTPYAGYLRECELKDGRVIGKELQGFKRCRVPVEHYSDVQNFLDEIVRKTNEKILIKKKS